MMPNLTPTEPPYLSGLNPTQREAVEATDGALLVLAGAGTGKTRVLTTRIAHIIAQGKAWPSQILAVTFTNKAAREMKERIHHIIGDQAEGLWIGTFHSIAVRILRQNVDAAGLKPNFTIIDTDDQLRVVKQLLAEHDIDDKQLPPKKLLTIIQRFKDRALTPEKLSDSDLPDNIYANIRSLYREYQERLAQVGAVDFGDLLLHVITLFQNHPAILHVYQERFRYILVDEYQDTNVAQYLWLRLLTLRDPATSAGYTADTGSPRSSRGLMPSAQAPNICCVGDDDQSIYGWRGAEVGNILRFNKDFPTAQTVRLEQNYRSTNPILGAASALISHNQGRLGKTLWTSDEGGEPVKVTAYENGFEEADRIADEIVSLEKNQRISPEQIAILVRAGYQTRAFESTFTSQGIAYRIVGGLRFYERKEIRDMIAYMRVMLQNADDLAYERIINTPKRGVGDASLQQIFKTASERQIPLMKAARQLSEESGLRPKIAKALLELDDQLIRWHKMLTSHHHAKVVETIAEESGYLAMLQEENTAEADGRMENISELVTALQDFESLTQFLEHVSLVTDADETSDAGGSGTQFVNIMTLHAAKGLEFDAVFLPAWEEGSFPSQKSIEESGSNGLEEERRLAYVGITRARKRLFISHAGSRMMYGQTQLAIPSRFIQELPTEHCDHLTSRRSYTPSPAPRRTIRESIPLMTGAELLKTRRVFHEKFGYGKIEHADGDNLTIFFDKAGRKTVREDFVTIV
jgi:DNA helicase-2/ATP-dependent DNA helicase PcrA